MPLTTPTGKRRILPAIRPNAGIEADYRRRMDDLIREMFRSTLYWVRARYRSDPPALLASD